MRRTGIVMDLLPAAGLALAGVLEALLGPGDGDRWVSAAAVLLATLPLAWRRTLPLLALAAVAVALLVQAPLGGFLVGQAVTPLLALLLALYSAGRHAGGPAALAAAALCIAAVVATRAAFDDSVARPADALLTLVAVTLPLLVGRWVRGQVVLQDELSDSAAQLARDRERAARQAAEEERMRIAADLQAAAAGGLAAIAERAPELRARLLAGDHERAHALNSGIAGTAREALADVRRVLGVLRRDGQAPRLAPPSAERPVLSAEAPPPAAPAPAPAPPEDQRAARLAPAHADRLLAGAVLAFAAVELVATTGRPLAALTAVPVAAALLARRHRPVPAALAVLGAIAVQSALLGLGAFPVADMAAVACASYATGAYAGRRAAVAGLALVAAGAAAHAAAFYPDGVVPALLGGVALPWTAGRIVRGHRRLTRERRDEAGRAEAGRARDARAAVTAERMRVARELHDAVAHNVSVIAIQAAGVEGIVERDPARAAGCAELIEAVAREALAELGRLSVAPAAADPAPPPSLARVAALADRARDGGLPVELRVEGEPGALPAGVDLAAFRIVQEALANASKHAAGAAARVVVRYEPRAVEVAVVDDGPGPAARNGSAAGGHGLVGMRERVALYGGTLAVGSGPRGGFEVRARLPVGRA